MKKRAKDTAVDDRKSELVELKSTEMNTDKSYGVSWVVKKKKTTKINKKHHI